MDFLRILWDDEEDLDGNVQHIDGRDLTVEDVEHVLRNPSSEGVMAKKKRLKRATRSGRLSAEQVAKDREVRRKIQDEFPPAPQEPIPDSLSEALKRAIQESGRTVYQIAKEAQVSQIMISRFLSGERDIRMATADKLANALGLKLIASS
jgi:ribosome-binding protein aMBF1 (putative translation factor)